MQVEMDLRMQDNSELFGQVFEEEYSLMGPEGKSAYQVAVKNGFEGSEEEWLASLQGKPGNDYILTPKDKTEIAEMAAELVEVPESNKSGLSAEASALLIEILRNGVYSADQSANITALASELSVTEPEEPDVPDIPDEPDEPEVTLSSISAAYSGGDVAVGTAVTDLTGIVVTAHYSDGSTETVTGYTLSGTIAEGSNTITVSYGGKSTTFAVTGVAEENEPVEVAMTMPHDNCGVRWGGSNLYSDGGSTKFTGTVGGAAGSIWISDIFEQDTVVTVAVLYGTTNANLRQYCGCLPSDTVLTAGSNDVSVYYLEQIGTASTNEYTAQYTVRAGYRLAFINYNSGTPQSLVVTK